MKTKIVIVGIGGVGGYYGGLFAQKYADNPTIEIYFVARGEHLKQIKEKGLKVITETGEFIAKPKLATDNVSEIGIADYIILCTKSYDLEQSILQLKPCINKNTVILPLLNGADISERIQALLPGNEVWKGCVYIVGRLNEPGVVESSGGVHDLFFGMENVTNERLILMEKLMLDAGIKAVRSEKINKLIWRKFIFISTTASLTSYFNVGFRDLLTDENRKQTTKQFLQEVIEIAKAEGIVYDENIMETIVGHIERLPFETTSSMHSDYKANRQIELNTLTKVVIELGLKHGIPTPIYKQVYETLNSRK